MIVTSAIHGTDATFSLNPPGSADSHANESEPNQGWSGFGAKNASRSTPGTLLRHQICGVIQLRWLRLEAVSDSTGDRIATQTSSPTAAVGACDKSGSARARRGRTANAIHVRTAIMSVNISTGVYSRVKLTRMPATST